MALDNTVNGAKKSSWNLSSNNKVYTDYEFSCFLAALGTKVDRITCNGAENKVTFLLSSGYTLIFVLDQVQILAP